MEYLFIYENEFDNYLKTNTIYIGDGFMYGSSYRINGHSAAVHRNYHEKVCGDVYASDRIDFEYLDNLKGQNYIRDIVEIYTEKALISCWVYLLKKI